MLDSTYRSAIDDPVAYLGGSSLPAHEHSAVERQGHQGVDSSARSQIRIDASLTNAR
jgi:hypothetical protein